MTSILSNNTPDHIVEFERSFASAQARSFGTSAPTNAADAEESLRKTIPDDMVKQVTNRMDYLQGRLAEYHGFDKQGKPIFALPESDTRRQALEKELHFLKTHTLPVTQARAAEVAAAKAALPTQDQKLREAAERNQRIHAAAVSKAEEMEIEELAKRMLADRRHGGGRFMG